MCVLIAAVWRADTPVKPVSATTPPPHPTTPHPSTHSLLLGRRCRRGGRQALLTVGQLAVGLPQRPLQLIDAGLVLQQEVLWLVPELSRKGKGGGGHVERRRRKTRSRKQRRCISKMRKTFWEAALMSAHLICCSACTGRPWEVNH